MNKIIAPEEFPVEWFLRQPVLKQKQGRRHGKGWKPLKSIIAAFDIETTTIDEIEQAVMYIWQLQLDEEYTIVGRTWEQFLALLKLMQRLLDGVVLVLYVHNLSYEFQFLRGIYDFKPSEVFAVKSRKVLKCTMFDSFEFRCSYLHSNMSLAEYTKKMSVKHQKLNGAEFDYSVKRYPWTPLAARELEYCVNDVLGLVEAIKAEAAFDEDDLYGIPLTSTGYVRRDTKKAMLKRDKDLAKDIFPNYKLYQMLREAFRGGNTHANRFYVGKTLHGVKSADRSSSYPDVICNCRFPVGQFGQVSREDFPRNVRGKAWVARVAIRGLELKNRYWGFPYIPLDKVRKCGEYTNDNGRLLNADYLEMTITDVDYMIIKNEYRWKCFDVLEIQAAKYGYLPDSIIDINCEYYRRKTELKGVEGQEIFYLKSKNKLNSVYGMTAQDPVKQDILFTRDENGLQDFVEQHVDPEKILEDRHGKAFLTYQWGVWVTAWARYRLEQGLLLAGDGGIYCDTDSVKYFGEIDWTKYNADRVHDSKESGAFANDPKGKIHYMGVFELEGEYAEFRTLGAKKYAYRYPGGELVTTVAGVIKVKDICGELHYLGGEELEAAGGIDALKPGFIFREAGGTESVYNDYPEIREWVVDGHRLKITSNVVIKPSTYKLGITAEYEKVLKSLPEIAKNLTFN